MMIQMELLEDTILGNGQSIPGEEDISVLRDEEGFPYYHGSTLKGIFREELHRLLQWKGEENPTYIERQLLGEGGANHSAEPRKLVFSDFVVSEYVRNRVLEETTDPNEILDAFSSLRTFTKINENGTVSAGSLRMARCINAGIRLFGEILCKQEDEKLVEEVLGLIHWVGTMRNRGFGRIRLQKV